MVVIETPSICVAGMGLFPIRDERISKARANNGSSHWQGSCLLTINVDFAMHFLQAPGSGILLFVQAFEANCGMTFGGSMHVGDLLVSCISYRLQVPAAVESACRMSNSRVPTILVDRSAAVTTCRRNLDQWVHQVRAVAIEELIPRTAISREDASTSARTLSCSCVHFRRALRTTIGNAKSTSTRCSRLTYFLCIYSNTHLVGYIGSIHQAIASGGGETSTKRK